MSDIRYSSEELVRLFASWSIIMEMWDDKKSHSINNEYFLHIRQCCRQLIDISENIHMQAIRIQDECDSIY